jgi:hypothetical protein
MKLSYNKFMNNQTVGLNDFKKLRNIDISEFRTLRPDLQF